MSLGDDILNAMDACDGSRETRERCDRSRAYDGQPHTMLGTRGKELVQGLTVRDVHDCYLRALLSASGDASLCRAADENDWSINMIKLVDYNRLDPRAVGQALCCNLERMMGIFPNLPNRSKPTT